MDRGSRFRAAWREQFLGIHRRIFERILFVWWWWRTLFGWRIEFQWGFFFEPQQRRNEFFWRFSQQQFRKWWALRFSIAR
ncbi:hypothetical protein Acid345_1183 [Candidatus Koribacter versatilis Ellin345]|uniref:Uncharacterized protein n=1 Tax=Koribacter versatilis (strain Ellin345) TaxID=204669 RepID=Q1ISG4_KORVE|nr:hypothetical protein [Candidatus Koribacter versatilis]ABF40186.1 hypothetical protein Acid345_1183 [Candidatus Koribacter versatilis Ellin345]